MSQETDFDAASAKSAHSPEAAEGLFDGHDLAIIAITALVAGTIGYLACRCRGSRQPPRNFSTKGPQN